MSINKIRIIGIIIRNRCNGLMFRFHLEQEKDLSRVTQYCYREISIEIHPQLPNVFELHS